MVAQELKSAGYELCYYNNNRKGERLGKRVHYLPLYMSLCLGSELEIATEPNDFAPPPFADWA